MTVYDKFWDVPIWRAESLGESIPGVPARKWSYEIRRADVPFFYESIPELAWRDCAYLINRYTEARMWG